jgi:hypothetical protein
LPTLLIGLWGFDYVHSCLMVLAAPGRPIVFHYKAPAGTVSIRADSYDFNLRQGFVTIYRPRLFDPGGGMVAQAGLVTLSKLDWRRLRNQRIEIAIDHLSGKLTRLPNGVFDLERLIPPRSAKPSPVAFHVMVRTANVEFIDTAGKGWSQAAYTPSVEVSGVGSDWIAHARLFLPGMGQADAGVQFAPGEGLHISGDTPGLKAGPALNHFLKTDLSRRYSTLASLSAGKIAVQGAFRLDLSTGKKPAFSLQSHLTAQDVVYGRYAVDSLTFQGVLTSKGAQGTLLAQTAGVNVAFTGVGSWSPTEAASGSLQLAAASPSALPRFTQVLLPKQLSFSGARYSGSIGYRKGQLFQAQGDLLADRIAYQKFDASSVRVQLGGNQDRIRAVWLSGSVEGVHPFGAADIDIRNKKLSAWARADLPDLNRLAQLGRVQGVSGSGEVEAFVNGPLQNPQVQFVAAGRASYRTLQLGKVGPESVDVAGNVDQGMVYVTRGLIRGSSGTVAVSGHVQPQNSRLTMQVDARALTPGELLPGFEGNFDGAADVTGTLTEPKFHGHAEGTNLKYRGRQIIAAAVAFSGNRRKVVANRVKAIAGTMDLRGSASCDLATQGLDGHFKLTGVQSTDFLGPNFAGIVDAPDIRVGGSVTKPLFIARLEAKELLTDEVVLSSMEALVNGTGSGVVLDHATASLAGGAISANGSYSFSTHRGVLTASTTDLDLGKLAPALGERVAITGTTAITEASATIDGKAIAGSAKGRLDNVGINGAAAGDGNWTVDSKGKSVHATLSVGQILPELRVLNVDAAYDLEAKTISGSFDASHARIQDLLGAASRYLPASWTADPAQLGSFTGDLTVGAKFSGSLTDPNAVMSTLLAENLTFQHEPLGTLTADGISRQEKRWTIPEVVLSGPEGEVSAKGTVQEHGQIAVSASGKDLKLSSLAPILSSFAGSAGIASFNLQASGESLQPTITGNAFFDHVLQSPSALQTSNRKLDDLSVTVPTISLDNSQAKVTGKVGFAGFTGSFSAAVPFTYKGGIGSGDAQASFSLDQRSLPDLPLIAQYIDLPRTSGGSLGGTISARGPIDKLTYSGSLNVSAKSIGFSIPDPKAYVKRIDDTLEDLSASLQLIPGDRVQFDAKTGLSRGGSVSLTASAPLIDLSPALHGRVEALVQEFMNSPLSGSIQIDGAKFRQTAPGGYVAAQLNGSTALGGTVGHPGIGSREKPGQVNISDLDTAMPTLPVAGGIGSVPGIDPSFYVDATLKNSARVRSATADLHVTGGGNLRGKLSDPRATANLVVQKGTIVLPGGTVRLDPGGTVDFSYHHPFGEQPAATLGVDLGGHTSITAVGYGRTPQRYKITLDIRGDLLKSQGLTMQATSDPPDLPSGDVLALLGGSDVFQNDNTGTAAQSDAERRITEAFAGFALPAVLNPYTSQLAQSLGLDYVSLEYNAFDQTTFSLARDLGSEFSLQFRGQIGTPTPGIRSVEDFELVYTPHRLPAKLRHLSLVVGADQDVPWKVALEYGIRFGQRVNASAGKRSVLFAPDRNASPSGSSKLPVGQGG